MKRVVIKQDKIIIPFWNNSDRKYSFLDHPPFGVENNTSTGAIRPATARHCRKMPSVRHVGRTPQALSGGNVCLGFNSTRRWAAWSLRRASRRFRSSSSSTCWPSGRPRAMSRLRRASSCLLYTSDKDRLDAGTDLEMFLRIIVHTHRYHNHSNARFPQHVKLQGNVHGLSLIHI